MPPEKVQHQQHFLEVSGHGFSTASRSNGGFAFCTLAAGFQSARNWTNGQSVKKKLARK